MARISYLLRRGASYYARVKVPTDLVDLVGRKELVKALGTKDENVAKREMWPVVEDWNRQFEDLRSRRTMTHADKADATWQHYNAVLERYEDARQLIPTEADIAAETAKLMRQAASGELAPADQTNAVLDLQVKKRARQLDTMNRSAKLDMMRQHLVEGETALIEHEVESYVETNRLLIDPAHPDWNDSARRMMRAEIAGLERTLERDKGNYSGHPTDPIVKPTTGPARETAAAGETIMELFEKYARENPNQIKPDTLAQARRDVGLFVDYVGSTFPVHRIDKKALREWKDLLLQYPVKASETKAFEGMKLAQIVRHNTTVKKPTISSTTVNRYLSGFSAFCTYLVNHGFITANPAADMFLKKSKEKTTKPFKTDEMNKLFKSPFFTGCQSDEAPRFWSKPGDVKIRDHRYWVPLIMLYSGARPAEIAQLGIDDVREDRGHWIMHITTEGDDDKSVKTEGSMRVVPVHPELVKLGFLKYHAEMTERGEKRLFPLAERNERGQMIADFSRDFPRYLTKIGLKDGRGLSLYSFRHGAADALRRANFLDEQFGFILGHTSGTMTQRYGTIPQGMLEQRVELVNAIAYPKLDISHLYVK